MKRYFFYSVWLLLLSGTQALAQSTPLFTYGKKEVSTDAFLRAFEKNPGTGNRQEALKEYLPLYINYVLKVQAAYDLRMDTLPQQMQDVDLYKGQLRENYIAEKAGLENLTDEAIRRLQEDILLGYIFFAGPSMYQAEKTANEAWQALNKGESWEKVASRYHSDPEMASRNGIAGWMTAFVLPYAFETAVYNLPTGGYSKPVSASDGIYIFSKRAARPGSGKTEVAQILLAFLPGMTEPEKASKKMLADSLAGLLKNGASVATLARTYSQDRTTNQTGGVIPAFTTGTYDAAFEAAAFSLKKPGDVSEPVVTSMGVHVLQLVSKTVPAELENPENRETVKQKVVSAGRLQIAQTDYLTNLMPAIPFKAASVSTEWLQAYTDSLLQTKEPKSPASTLLFTYGKQRITLGDWVAYARVQSYAGRMAAGTPVAPEYQRFKEGKKLEYIKNNLEEADPAFAGQLKDFKEANLLFEAMTQQVWNKAASDSTGLRTFYNKNKDRYRWGANAMAILVNSNDSLIAQKAHTALNSNLNGWRELGNNFANQVFADSGRYEATLLPLKEEEWPAAGKCSVPQSNPLDGSYSFMCLVKKGEAGGSRSFEEAKGYVISDYQDALEKNWLDSLRKKYPVKINQTAWNLLLSGK